MLPNSSPIWSCEWFGLRNFILVVHLCRSFCNGNFVFFTAELWKIMRKILPVNRKRGIWSKFADAVGVLCSSSGRSFHPDERGSDLSMERFERQMLSVLGDAERVIICKWRLRIVRCLGVERRQRVLFPSPRYAEVKIETMVEVTLPWLVAFSPLSLFSLLLVLKFTRTLFDLLWHEFIHGTCENTGCSEARDKTSQGQRA